MANAQTTFIPCPFTNQPFADCAAKAITGASIPKITRFCMGDYALCPVYKKMHERPAFEEVLDSTVAEKKHQERRLV